MNVLARLQALEAAITASAAEPEDDPNRWWVAAPPAVLAYYAAVDAELQRSPLWRESPDAAIEALYAQHPLLDTVQQTVDLEALRPGEPVNLQRVQWWLLSDAWGRLSSAVAAARGNLHDPETARQVRLLLYGMAGDDGQHRHGAAWTDRTGETWITLWRETTAARTAETLATAGILTAEAALLATDDDV